MNDEKIIIIDVNLTRGLAVVLIVGLLTIALLSYLAFGHEEAAASSPRTVSQGSAGIRQYYLTPNRHTPTEALNICSNGYHFASLWEILDTSNLKYNTVLGLTSDDSGSGPTTLTGNGWVRTGYDSNSSTTSSPGQANCEAWTNTSGSAYGSVAYLNVSWRDYEPHMHVWLVDAAYCDHVWHVWCVED